MTELARGARDLTRGLAFLNKHPRLWGWVIAPAVVTLIVIVGIIIALASVADSIVTKVTAWLPASIADIGEWVVWIVVLAAIVVAGVLMFVSIAGLVAGPFNELLSEAVEEKVTGKPGPPFSLGAFVRGALAGIAHGLRRLAVTLLGVALLFVLGFIPVVGTIAALVLGGYITACGAAYDCYDAVLSRRAIGYREKLEYLKLRRSRTLGLGAAVAGLLLVPGLNLVALGLGATGATLAALDDPAAQGVQSSAGSKA